MYIWSASKHFRDLHTFFHQLHRDKGESGTTISSLLDNHLLGPNNLTFCAWDIQMEQHISMSLWQKLTRLPFHLEMKA
ncbi:hypothetical protein ILYODFUR_039071 [Ilyodon furcidens]|uniref:Uncharacterized protein n=1 Tax=Ilyodon furcidens TaxID=33524 RepID=A0ABV0V1N5_9TELE